MPQDIYRLRHAYASYIVSLFKEIDDLPGLGYGFLWDSYDLNNAIFDLYGKHDGELEGYSDPYGE